MEGIAILREWLLALNEKVDMKVKPENKEWFLELIDKTIEVTQPIDENDFEAVAEVCTERFAKAMRAKGWLHKDDPVKGLKVVKTCPCEELSARENCECIPERPLTVGEALDMLKGIFDAIEEIKFCFINETNSCFDQIFKHEINLIDNALSTKDGGRIVREE